jgi:type IV pilus assembly protein PilC
MKRYNYKAINETGRYLNGTMSAENPSSLIAMLRASGLELISYKEEKRQQVSFLGKIKPEDLISMFIHLEQLDKAGISIIDSLTDFMETSDSVRVKNLIQEVHESIKNGNLFSESLAKHPNIFTPTYISLIRMGERTGNLANSFSSIIEDIKWNNDIRRKTKKAMRGPLFGVILIFIVMGVMNTIVVPKVTGFLVMQGLKLPLMTIALIKFSNFFQSYWYFLVAAWPTFSIVTKILKRNEEFAVKIDDLKLKIPVIGAVMNKIEAAKFCQFFAMTFKSGLGILECLEAASEAVRNIAMKRSIISVKQQVSEGKSLASSIASTGYFPTLVVRMFKIGEESGNMESALQNIKFFYDREVDDSIDKLVGMIQPTLTIVMGTMIGWITIAVFGPIYSSFSNIK